MTIGGGGTVDVSRPPKRSAMEMGRAAVADVGLAVLLVLGLPVVLIGLGSLVAFPLWVIMVLAGRL